MVNKDIQSVLIYDSEIKEIVKGLATKINKDYSGEQLLVVCMLKGSCIFFSDLIRELDLDIRLEFMRISSYGNSAKTSNNVKIIHDLQEDIKGKNVLIVEDIIDSGRTIKNLKELLAKREPKSLRVATMLDKPDRREVDINGEYIGKVIPNEFVVGYGLDYAQKYRNLKDICVLAKSVYLN